MTYRYTISNTSTMAYKVSPTYGRNVHIPASRGSNKEINANTAFNHFASKLFEPGMICLEQLFLCLNAMQVILVSQKKPTWAPSW